MANVTDPAPQLSIVVPVYNERDNLLPLLREINAALDGICTFDVIYVNDGSNDDSGAVLERLAGRAPFRLRVVTHDRRRGQSSALVSGVRAARGEWVATLDGDGQNVPGDVPMMLAMAVAAHSNDPDAVCVAGIRRRRSDSRIRLLSSRIANAVRRGLLSDGIPDTGCGLKIFRRDAFLGLPQFDHMHRFLPALFQFYGGRVLTTTVSHRARFSGESKYGVLDRLWVGIVDLVGVRWLRSRAIQHPWRAA